MLKVELSDHLLSHIVTPHDSLHDALPDVVFDYRSNRWRYRDSRKFASMDAVRSLAAANLDRKTLELDAIGKDLISGKITSIQASRQMADVVKSVHLSGMVMALDRQDDLQPGLFGQVGRELKRQYYQGKDWETGKPYGLKWLIRDWEQGQGDVGNDERLLRRLKLFGESYRTSYWQTKTSVARFNGKTMARRVLGAAEHCPQCPEYSARGWVPIAEVIPPTADCQCRVKCKCTIVYQ